MEHWKIKDKIVEELTIVKLITPVILATQEGEIRRIMIQGK
jgi:hypothetical protein